MICPACGYYVRCPRCFGYICPSCGVEMDEGGQGRSRDYSWDDNGSNGSDDGDKFQARRLDGLNDTGTDGADGAVEALQKFVIPWPEGSDAG